MLRIGDLSRNLSSLDWHYFFVTFSLFPMASTKSTTGAMWNRTKRYNIANGNRRKVYGPIQLLVANIAPTKMRQRAQDSSEGEHSHGSKFPKVTKPASRIFQVCLMRGDEMGFG
ncbi:hypothetical protein CEXT_535571 [Caerostris extrusa]|uniref:Uncharacterized protein n=1 Tax=Caerostris extrusa TaxID=172846 RepID=A0AAV4XE40_CAEEX|nr:hypothetical protein CEXT_535571 [Caerostris extrusa]